MVTYSPEEVSKHNTEKSLWITHNNKVYDVTDFAQRHPGGAPVLCKHAGQDVSHFMSDPVSHTHSKVAYQILNKYCIGDLGDPSLNVVSKTYR